VRHGAGCGMTGGKRLDLRQRGPTLVVALLIAAFAAQAIASARLESATWDETHYFGLGTHLLKTRRWDVAGSILHPPLSYGLHSLPLLFADLPADAFRPLPEAQRTRRALAGIDVVRGRALLASPANDGNALLLSSRLMMILVGALGAVFVYRWGRELYGVPAGLLATCLYAFSPNLLAHTRLITPDIALTVFAFGATFFFWRSLGSQRRCDALWAGVLLGLALLSKFTALLWPPLFAALLAVWSIRTGQRPPRRAFAVFGVAGAVLLLGYGFDLRPYVEGIAFQLEHTAEGHPAFFAGRYADGGWWYYALMSLLLKTPLPSLLLLGASAIRLGRRRNRSRWLDEGFVLLPPLAVIAFFSVQHQSIGLRYVLPALPFLLVFASGVLATGRLRGFARVALAGLLAWVLAASLSIHPHYLAYFNETVGGPARGYRYLVDSNLDWGQDLVGLATFLRERDIERVHLSYFGTDSPARYGIRYDWLPSFHLERPNRTREFQLPRHGWFAISATHLQGLYLPDRDLYAFLREQQPVARIGYSIFVYHLE